METSEHPWMSTTEAGERLGIPRQSVIGLIESKWLPAFKFSGIWAIDRPGVEKVAKALKTESVAP